MSYGPQRPIQLLHVLNLPRQEFDLRLGIFYRFPGHVRFLGLSYYVVRDRFRTYYVLLEGLCVANPGGDVVFRVLIDLVNFQLDGS